MKDAYRSVHGKVKISQCYIWSIFSSHFNIYVMVWTRNNIFLLVLHSICFKIAFPFGEMHSMSCYNVISFLVPYVPFELWGDDNTILYRLSNISLMIYDLHTIEKGNGPRSTLFIVKAWTYNEINILLTRKKILSLKTLWTYLSSFVDGKI